MKFKLELPEYLTIEAFSKLGDLEGLSQIETIVRVLNAITGYDVEDIRKWDINSLNQVHMGIMENLLNFENIIIPVFEFEGQLWGMQQLSKMTVGEYIDLERLIGENNIAEVMAIIYRPIIKNKLDSFERKIMLNLNAVMGTVDHIMKWYEVEPYDNESRYERAQILKKLPMAVASGAYSFFLLIGLQLQLNSLTSSPDLTEMDRKMLIQEADQVLANFMGGFTFSQN